jgi:hypothetical protein
MPRILRITYVAEKNFLEFHQTLPCGGNPYEDLGEGVDVFSRVLIRPVCVF